MKSKPGMQTLRAHKTPVSVVPSESRGKKRPVSVDRAPWDLHAKDNGRLDD
jgi:hypothetical protein